MTDLRDLRLHPRLESDLRWFFNDAAGEMGLQSNHGAFMARMEGASSGARDTYEANPRQLEAADRYQRIEAGLRRITEPEHRRVLEAAYGPVRRLGLEAFGQVGAVVLVAPGTAQAHARSRSDRTLEDWVVRLSWRVRQKKGATLAADRSLVREITRGAEELLAAASRAYENSRRAPGRHLTVRR